jgi:molybdate transport system substrate-binding protein
MLIAALGLIAGGCSSKEEGKLLILCGKSFRLPMEAMVKQYEQQTGTEVEMSFGGSEELFPHVKLKSQGDLYVAHDPFIDDTKTAGSLTRAVAVGELVPVLVVKKGNPKGIQKIEDLARPGVRVILPDPKYATAGEMVVELFKKKGTYDAVMKNVEGALVRSHSDVAEHVRSGDRDAGMMWNGVARSGEWTKELDVVPAPAEYSKPVQVAVMGLSYSKRPAQVEQFLKFTETHGRKVFAEFGYVK